MEKPISLKIADFRQCLLNALYDGLKELDVSVVQLVLTEVMNEVNGANMSAYENDLRKYTESQEQECKDVNKNDVEIETEEKIDV